MNLMPEEDLTQRASVNLAPMVDFLFLILAVFAVLSITTSKVFMEEIDLAQSEDVDESSLASFEMEPLHLFVNKEGEYLLQQEDALLKFHKCQHLAHELHEQQASGQLPEDTSKVNILLHIDRQAEWEFVMQLLLGLQNAGFNVQTVYQQAPSA